MEEDSSFHGEGGARRLRRCWRAARLTPRARLIICHGAHEHSGRYKTLAAVACAKGIECHALDLRGHGQSAGERGDIGSLDGAIADLIDLVRSIDASGEARLPLILLGHSLGSMITFLAAHHLATTPELRTPDMVIMSGFAMDSLSPPFGIQQLTPVLRQLPSIVYRVTSILAAVQPQGPACPFPAPKELTSCPEQADRALSDPLNYHGWIQNRTALALLAGRARCRSLLPVWGSAFPFLLVHGGADNLCPVSAPETLMRASPQPDKQLRVFDGLKHEVLLERQEDTEKVFAHIFAWVERRLTPEGRKHELQHAAVVATTAHACRLQSKL